MKHHRLGFQRPSGTWANWLILLSLLAMSLGCAKTTTVYVPPRMDLAGYERVGIIGFSSNQDPELDRYVTEQFQNQIQGSQPGVRILELGSRQQVFQTVGATELDPETIRKIGQHYRVQALFHGDIQYSDIQTELNVSEKQILNAGFQAFLEATLSAKLRETDSGATAWGDSVTFRRKLGGAGFQEGGEIRWGLRAEEDPHRKLVPDMAHAVTEDFRGSYERRRID
jgi:hypothetical protein